MGWIIALIILFGLAILPMGIRVRYDERGAYVWMTLGCIKFLLVPAKKKTKKEAPDQKKPVQKPDKKPEKQVGKAAPDPKPEQEEAKASGGSVLDFLPLLQRVLEFLGDFRRKLRINTLEMKLIMAGDDPCDLATNYGRAWAALGNLMPKLEQLFVIKNRNLEVECDFTAEQTLVVACLDISITFGRLLAALVRFAWRALKEYLKIMKKRKGGAKQ